jgi:hypothetical protein
MTKGAKWKHVRAASLSQHAQQLYREYVATTEAARASGERLKKETTREWNDKYPNGIDGQVCTFNVVSGALLYAMKPKTKQQLSTKKGFDADRGDDVFSRSSIGLPGKHATEPEASLPEGWEPNPGSFVTVEGHPLEITDQAWIALAGSLIERHGLDRARELAREYVNGGNTEEEDAELDKYLIDLGCLRPETADAE